MRWNETAAHTYTHKYVSIQINWLLLFLFLTSNFSRARKNPFQSFGSNSDPMHSNVTSINRVWNTAEAKKKILENPRSLRSSLLKQTNTKLPLHTIAQEKIIINVFVHHKRNPIALWRICVKFCRCWCFCCLLLMSYI